MKAIYLFTTLWLANPDTSNTYTDHVVNNAYINKADCLEVLDEYELLYRRAEEKYVVDSYTKTNVNQSGDTIGFSVKDKTSESIRFYECQSVFLLDR